MPSTANANWSARLRAFNVPKPATKPRVALISKPAVASFTI
jgi:hypothetical protein